MSNARFFLPLSLLLSCTSAEPARPPGGRLQPQLAALLDSAFRDRMLLLYLYPDSLSFRYRAIVMPVATKRVFTRFVPDEVAVTAHNTVFLYTGRRHVLLPSASVTQQLHAYDQRLDQLEEEAGVHNIFPYETRHYRLNGSRWEVDSVSRTLIPIVENAPPPPPFP